MQSDTTNKVNDPKRSILSRFLQDVGKVTITEDSKVTTFVSNSFTKAVLDCDSFVWDPQCVVLRLKTHFQVCNMKL